MQPNARQLYRDDTLHHVSETQLAVELQRRVIDFTLCLLINNNSYRKLPFGTNKTFLKQATPRMCWDSLGPPSRALVDLPQKQQHGVTIAASPWRPRQHSSRGNKCIRSGTLPTGSALRTGTGEELPLPFFSLRGEAFPAVVSPLLLLVGDIKLNPGTNCYTCGKPNRRGIDYLQCQANSCTNGSHKQLRCSGFHRSQLTNSWRCPPHGGPGPPHRAPTTSAICDSCQQPIRAGIRPLTCATTDCPRLGRSARRCNGLSTRQGR